MKEIKKIFFKLIFFIFLIQINLHSNENLIFKEIEFSHLILDKEYENLIQDFWDLVTNKNKNCMVALNPENNKLIARGTEKQLVKLQKFIKRIDIKEQSVKINVIIIETKKNLDLGFGINWSGIYNRLNTIQQNNEGFNFVGVSSNITDIPEPPTYINEGEAPFLQQFGNLYVNPCRFAINLFPNSYDFNKEQTTGFLCSQNPEDQTLYLPVVFGGENLNLQRLNAVINANEASNNLSLVSKPNLLTKNKIQSELLIGESLPYYYITTELTPQNNVRFITTMYFRDIGVNLKVIPRILPDQKIELTLKAETVFKISGSTKTAINNLTGATTTNLDPIQLEILNLRHKLITQDKEIIIIGDFVRPTSKISENKIPFLYKVPIIKNLFKGYKISKEELKNYIFLQAEIIK